MPQILRVRNFERYQHYKQRNPPWIKVYSSMLDDYAFQKLPDGVKFHCVGLMLLASRVGNELPNDTNWLAAKIGANSEIDISLLIDFGFLEFADSAEKAEDASPVSGNFEEFPENQRNGHSLIGNLGQFTKNDYLRLIDLKIQRGEPIKNKHGLANYLMQTGNEDAAVIAEFYPQMLAAEEEKLFGPAREFTDEPCTICFGSGMETVKGKGAKKCDHCKNERGKSTGKEPLTITN